MTAPIFIVGANRSGTTLLRLLLNAHSRIAIPEELVYFDTELPYEADVREWRTPGFSREQYRDVVRWFTESNRETLAPLSPEEVQAEILDETDEDFAMDLRRPYQKALERWARHYGKARWGEKTPGNLFFVKPILEMFPRAQFIYIVRDPRAGVHSMMKTDLFADDVVINAINRRKYDTQGRVLLQRTVPAPQRTTVRYEDLVRRPEETVQALCRFLGEPFEPGMMRFHEDAEAYMKTSAARGYNEAATRPIDPGRIHAWRDALTPVQQALVESVCREPMARFGYAPEGAALPWARRTEVWAKRAYFRLQSWRNGNKPQYTMKHCVFARLRRRLRVASQKPAVWAHRARNAFTA